MPNETVPSGVLFLISNHFSESMSQPASVSHWIEQLKQGNDDAGQELWNRYMSNLIELARQKLRNVPKRDSDEEDLVISAFNAFLMGVRANRFTNLKSRSDLWQVLVMLTERKAVDQIRRQLSLKRGGGRVRGESVFENQNANLPGSSPGIEAAVTDPQPTPEFAFQFAESLQFCMAKLDDEVLQTIVLQKLEGYTNKEIASKIERSLSSVERKLRLIRHLWVK